MNNLHAQLGDKYGPWEVANSEEVTQHLTRHLVSAMHDRRPQDPAYVIFGRYIESLRRLGYGRQSRKENTFLGQKWP